MRHGLTASCIAVAVLSFHALYADHLMAVSLRSLKAGNLNVAAADLHEAQDLEPAVSIYAINRCNLIMELFPYADPQKQRELAKTLVRIAGQHAALRPNDPTSWQLFAAVEAFLSRPKQSVLFAKQAQQLDPTLPEPR